MAEFIYCDEKTFKNEPVIIRDEIVEIIEQLNNVELKNVNNRENFHCKTTQVIINPDKESMSFGVRMCFGEYDRSADECGEYLYRVTVQKYKA